MLPQGYALLRGYLACFYTKIVFPFYAQPVLLKGEQLYWLSEILDPVGRS